MNQQNRRKSFFWILLWVICFSTAMAFAKMLKQSNPNIPLHILVMIRSFFAFAFVLPLATREGFKQAFKVEQKKLILARMITIFCTVYCTYFAYQNLPLATATSIGFSGPLFSISFAVLLLGENFPIKKWLYVILGYVGVLVIINPAGIAFEPAIVISVLSNILAGLGQNMTKLLTRTEKSVTLVLYGTGFNFIMSSALLTFLPGYLPTVFEFMQMSFIGGLGVFSSFCYTQSLRYSSPTFVAPFEYTRILYAIPVGFIFFSELPTLQTYLGAAVIILAITLLNRKSKPKGVTEASDSLELEEKVVKQAS